MAQQTPGYPYPIGIWAAINWTDNCDPSTTGVKPMIYYND